jgi:hypothetical protein
MIYHVQYPAVGYIMYNIRHFCLQNLYYSDFYLLGGGSRAAAPRPVRCVLGREVPLIFRDYWPKKIKVYVAWITELRQSNRLSIKVLQVHGPLIRRNFDFMPSFGSVRINVTSWGIMCMDHSQRCQCQIFPFHSSSLNTRS